MRAIRWGDNDRYFGPFTWSVSNSYKRIAISLHSGGHGDDCDGPPSLRISIWKWTLIMVLPFMIPPQRRWVPVSNNEFTVAGYYDIQPREYGFSYSDGFLLVHYGINPCDSSRDQTWSRHLPWTQWRHVRISFYGRQGELIGTILDKDHPRGSVLGSDKYDLQRQIEERTPKVIFTFRDFDGEALMATTYIEEREWWFGTGWFKWLAWLRAPRIRRYLEIRFSGETGRRKGSWKGGTIGHSIDMPAGWEDTHLTAFIRYCREHDMEWTGWANSQ